MKWYLAYSGRQIAVKKKSNLIVMKSDEELALTESPIPLSPPKQMSYFDC